jgi:uncharacterized protein YjbI with pentapeptide repeats
VRTAAVASLLLLFAVALASSMEAAAADPKCPFAGKRPPMDKILKLPPRERPSLCQTNLSGAILVEADLREADLTEADLTGANLTGANLTGANLTGANLSKAHLIEAMLSKAKLSEANLSAAVLVSADLRNARLLQANLSRAVVSGANFSAADLYRADLSGATVAWEPIVNVDFSRANLFKANLSGAQLRGAILSGAMLLEANLSRTDLSGADLSQAGLSRANLSGSNLAGAKLSGVYLYRTNLEGAILEDIDTGILTSWMGLEYAKGLSRITFTTNPSMLFAMREHFAKRGLRDQEREVTFAKLQTQRRLSFAADKPIWSRAESIFSYFAFELLCGYGLYYGRPLRILGAMIPILALVYMLAFRSRGRGAIWRVWKTDRILEDEGQAKPERLSWETLRWPQGIPRGFAFRLCRAYGLGLLFSLLSAFQIGWRELNVGNWITRLLPREYTLQATGWVRVLAGAQSLLSVYLLALWALTYFGRPFE